MTYILAQLLTAVCRSLGGLTSRRRHCASYVTDDVAKLVVVTVSQTWHDLSVQGYRRELKTCKYYVI